MRSHVVLLNGVGVLARLDIRYSGGPSDGLAGAAQDVPCCYAYFDSNSRQSAGVFDAAPDSKARAPALAFRVSAAAASRWLGSGGWAFYRAGIV